MKVENQLVGIENSFPENYGRNKITLLVRDPYWIHAYWEISSIKLEQAKKEFGGEWPKVKSILRIYDVTTIDFNGLNANNFYDIEITGETSNWYINVVTPNSSYCVDIGLRLPEGKFYTLARSNTVSTPRDQLSEVIDEEWIGIDAERMYALSGGFDVTNSSLEVTGGMKKELQAHWASGGISSFGGNSSIGGIGEIGSGGVIDIQEKRSGFRFNLDAELIVYGATEPNAKVMLQDKLLKLRPDGTFTARFALPDGTQVIPVTAVSNDGIESRTVIPIISRQTTK
ncbi:MAG: DUF4912 domain-containing protein [bacterium]